MHRASAVLVLACLAGSCGLRTIQARIAGAWNSVSPIVGTGSTMTLTQNGRQITGSGIYRIEAGGGGTFQVMGTFDVPSLSLNFAYDRGATAKYMARLSSPNRITGTITYADFGPSKLEFVRPTATGLGP
jgi:hypothetical protein